MGGLVRLNRPFFFWFSKIESILHYVHQVASFIGISCAHFRCTPMDITHRNLRNSFSSCFPPADFAHKSNFRSSGFKLTTKLQFPIIISSSNELKCYRQRHRVRNSSLMLQCMVSKNDGNGDDNFKSSGNWIRVSRSLFPDGSWWNLDEHQKVEIGAAKPLLVYLALRRMWKLVWDSNRWLLLVAFGALTIAAVRGVAKFCITHCSFYRKNLLFSVLLISEIEFCYLLNTALIRKFTKKDNSRVF